MNLWIALLDVLILLAAAMILGGLCERMKQSAILGYLLAGTLLGPNALNLMPNHAAVATIAELGVALLLFTIGLEFSWRRLRRIGAIGLGGGTMQVVVTGALSAWICIELGLELHSGIAVGAMIALSSTAAVLRLLIRRGEFDSRYGRNAVGILLLQDIAVVPLVLIITILSIGGSAVEFGLEMGRALGTAAILVGVLFLMLNYVVPLFLKVEEAARNRELPTLLAIVMVVGAGWVSRELGLSPVLGAFVAGMLLAESPFATQIRADITPLRTLFVTLFFSSIGMLSNPTWILKHWELVAVVVATIIFGKTVIVSGIARLFRSSPGHAIATGICIAQVGEFSFVLAEVARGRQLISGDVFELIVAATIVTLFLTPYLIDVAPRIAAVVGRLSAHGLQELHPLGEEPLKPDSGLSGHIVIVGFGPAGKQAAEAFIEQQEQIVIVELRSKLAAEAQSYGLLTYIGDATHIEVLEHLHLGAAKAVVVAIPDPTTVRHITEQIRSLSPETIIIARARYHKYRSDLILAGVNAIIDEEKEVGLHIVSKVQEVLQATDSESRSTNDKTSGPQDGNR